MGRISLAVRSFLSILSSGTLSDDLATELQLVPKAAKTATAAKPVPVFTAADGALQMLGILQRDARLIDFLMEDIASFSDDQVGAAVRNVHEQSRSAVTRYVTLEPVIDGVEGAFTKVDAAGTLAKDAAAVKLLGNVPADGRAQGGTLRHRGWKATRTDLPALAAKANVGILSPAELEVE